MTLTPRVVIATLLALPVAALVWRAQPETRGTREAPATSSVPTKDAVSGAEGGTTQKFVSATDDSTSRPPPGGAVRQKSLRNQELPECPEPGDGYPCIRPAIYWESGFGDPSHPYSLASIETLQAFADSGDGAAYWHLANKYVYTDQEAAGLCVVAASALLESPEPVLYFVEQHISSTDQFEQALPYLLYASDFGRVPWRLTEGTAEQIDAALPRANELREYARSLR